MNDMVTEQQSRLATLQAAMEARGGRTALIADEASIAYLAGFWGHLGVEFGRPTILVLRAGAPPAVVTPLMESEMVAAMTWVDDIRPWEDSGPHRWPAVLAALIGDGAKEIWVERAALPALVRSWLDEAHPHAALRDIGPLLGAQRMMKSQAEIEIMRDAGRVAGAMMAAAEASLAEGAPEYESALAVMAAGTRAAAALLDEAGPDRYVSPLIHGLQVLQSGGDTSMVHRRASVKRYRRGDPVYFCFCNMAEFRHYRLGFDRMFHIGEISDDAARTQQAAIDAQAAAIAAIRPGALAEDVAAAADEVYRARGYETGYRTGRSIGMSYLEAPELKPGDRTELRPGMTFAVDGGISTEGCGGRIGDSVVVTADGAAFLTDYRREIMVV